MVDQPIAFGAPAIQALRTGKKVQDRRIIPGVHIYSPEYDRQWYPHVCPPGGAIPDEWSWWEGPSHGPSIYHLAKLDFAVGDRLWVQESFKMIEGEDRDAVHCRADEDGDGPWRPAADMTREQSRLTLIVKDIDVERLHDISVDDAIAEGAWKAKTRSTAADQRDAHKSAFAALWTAANGAESWEKNLWVAVLDFEVVKTNIDQLPDPATAPPVDKSYYANRDY